MAATIAAGTIVLVAWGMVFWAILYDPLKVFGDLPPGVAEAAKVLERAGTPTGAYFHPWPRNSPETAARWLEAHRRGPFFELRYVREGVDPQSPAKVLRGVLHHAVVAALAFGLCLFAAGRGSRPRPVPVLLLAGTAGSVWTRLADPVWFHLPVRHAALLFGHDLVVWLLLGLTYAWFLRPPRSSRP